MSEIKKKVIKQICTIIVIVIIFVCLIGTLLAYIPARMSKAHTNNIVDLYFSDMGYSVSDFEEKWLAKTTDYKLTSDRGHSIPVSYICANDSIEEKTIILVHWHETNHLAMYPIAEMFLQKGWNVVLYDQRAHGDNTAKTVTFGYLESEDLQAVVNFTYEKSNGTVIGALGQSMGAATVAYYSGTGHADKYLDFAIIDSVFSGMYEEIYWYISNTKVPLPAVALTRLGDAFNDLFYGYGYSDVSITSQIQSNNIPTLILHSKQDKKCPYYMGQELYDNIPHDNKKLVTFESSEHLGAFWDENERYKESVFSFIDEFIK